jgi:hypothetical protein
VSRETTIGLAHSSFVLDVQHSLCVELHSVLTEAHVIGRTAHAHRQLSVQRCAAVRLRLSAAQVLGQGYDGVRAAFVDQRKQVRGVIESGQAQGGGGALSAGGRRVALVESGRTVMHSRGR